jgi:AP-2 complex subunit alpha
VRKKAALCLLRLLRKTPVDQLLINAETFSPIMIGLLEDRDLGVLLGSVTLLLGICTRTGSSKCEVLCVHRLFRFGKQCLFNL